VIQLKVRTQAPQKNNDKKEPVRQNSLDRFAQPRIEVQPLKAEHNNPVPPQRKKSTLVRASAQASIIMSPEWILR
jgi:hypothetical protein